MEIALRHEIAFLEIGTDRDHVHFLMQSVPTYSPTKIVRTVKSITAREFFRFGGCLLVKRLFYWHGGASRQRRNIRRYLHPQGCEDEYKRLYQQPINLAPLNAGQMELF